MTRRRTRCCPDRPTRAAVLTWACERGSLSRQTIVRRALDIPLDADPDDPCDECGTPTEPCSHGFALCDLHRTLGCQPCADEQQADTRDDAAINARREGP